MSVRRVLGVGSWMLALSAAVIPAGAEAQVRFERTGFRLTSIGERVTVSGRVLDARRRPVPSTRLRWRITDPSIASVSPQGIVVSRRTGNTRLWAVAGSDSASALIVVDQWAAKFEFVPGLLRLEAVGAKATVRVSVRDAEGHPIADQSRKAGSSGSLNERVARFAENGEVTARANGVTYVRCTDRGVSDSVRVEVRQRPARVTIADKQTYQNPKYVGEIWSLRLTAQDRSGEEIRDPQVSWASLNPSIISVDPLSGATRAVGAGTARVVALVGDVTDTLQIPVSPSLGQPVPQNTDTATTIDVTTVRVPTLDIESFNTTEGEQTAVRFTARDASGAEVKNAEVLLRTSDTSIIAVLPGLKVQSKRAGTAWVVGRFGNASDSVQVIVRGLASARAAADPAADPTRAIPFVRPTVNSDSLLETHRVFRSRVDSALRDSRIVRTATGRFIAIDGVVGHMAYSFNDTTGLEKRSGLVYGGAADVAPFKWARLSFDLRTGALAPKGTTAPDIVLTQASADLTLQPADYLGVRVGTILRAMREEGTPGAVISRQLWTIPRASVVSRLNFIGGRLATVLGLSILPASKYSGTDVKPEQVSYSGEAGLEFNWNWFTSDLIYSTERLNFPKEGAQRLDQFSTLRVRLGLRRGR